MLAVLVLSPVAGLLIYRVAPVPITPLIVVRLMEGEGWRQRWVPLEDVASEVPRAVIASEDARFCSHHGFDWVEIRKAWSEWRAGGRLRGASTLSMQTARSVFLWPGRDGLRKGLEALLTLPLEAVWSKRRILEVYLNVAEWGPGIYGIQAAAQYHFGQNAASLTARQAALLVAILPAPRRWSAGTPGPAVIQRAGTIQARARLVALGPGNTPCSTP